MTTATIWWQRGAMEMEKEMSEAIFPPLTSAACILEWAPDHMEQGVLTTDHSASSYGIPVLVVGNQVYGPDDLPATAIIWYHGATAATYGPSAGEFIQAVMRAGYRLKFPTDV